MVSEGALHQVIASPTGLAFEGSSPESYPDTACARWVLQAVVPALVLVGMDLGLAKRCNGLVSTGD